MDLVEQAVLGEGFSGEKIASMIESIYNGINQPDLRECYHFFFWDVFICTAALLIEYEKYMDLRKILNRTYFLRDIIGTSNDPEPYSFSQFRQYHWALENVYRPKINPRLVSLSADMLVKREHGSVISKRNLVTADTTLAHLAMIYGQADFTWYPILAPYSHYAGCTLIWERLISRAFCENCSRRHSRPSNKPSRRCRMHGSTPRVSTIRVQASGAFGLFFGKERMKKWAHCLDKTCPDIGKNIEQLLAPQERELVAAGGTVRHLIVDCSP